MSYVVLWRFRVRPERIAAFERAYGANGDWARLFARCNGFIGVELVRDVAVPGLYVTIDRWRSPADYDAMLREHVDEYARMDAECEGLTLTEEKIGAFRTPDVSTHS